MKYLALVTLSSILVSCSSTKPSTLATSSTPKAPVKLGQTWMATVSMGKWDKRAPASVKDAEVKELIKSMNTHTGWRTVPVGKAITREDAYYVDGHSQVDNYERVVIRHGKNSYFDMVKYESGYELQTTTIEQSADAAIETMRKSLTAIKKSGPSLYSLFYTVESEDFKANCELKMDLQKSPLFFNSICKDPQGRLIQDSKVVTSRDVNIKDFASQLSDTSISVCPHELAEEEHACVNDQKKDWSYLVK